jgi:hypothetical protein
MGFARGFDAEMAKGSLARTPCVDDGDLNPPHWLIAIALIFCCCSRSSSAAIFINSFRDGPVAFGRVDPAGMGHTEALALLLVLIPDFGPTMC